MTDRKLMQQALEALEGTADFIRDDHHVWAAVTALRSALEQPQQEPVATWENKYGMREWEVHALRAGWMPTPPAPRTEQTRLTDGEIDALAMDEDGLPNSHIEFARSIEAKLREKNA